MYQGGALADASLIILVIIMIFVRSPSKRWSFRCSFVVNATFFVVADDDEIMPSRVSRSLSSRSSRDTISALPRNEDPKYSGRDFGMVVD